MKRGECSRTGKGQLHPAVRGKREYSRPGGSGAPSAASDEAAPLPHSNLPDLHEEERYVLRQLPGLFRFRETDEPRGTKMGIIGSRETEPRVRRAGVLVRTHAVRTVRPVPSQEEVGPTVSYSLRCGGPLSRHPQQPLHVFGTPGHPSRRHWIVRLHAEQRWVWGAGLFEFAADPCVLCFLVQVTAMNLPAIVVSRRSAG